MEWCHQILFINALTIYCRRPYVIVIIFQRRYFVSMCLAFFMHIPQDVSAIMEGFHLLKCGECCKKIFSNFNVFGCDNCYEMKTGLSCACFHVSLKKINVVGEIKYKKTT